MVSSQFTDTFVVQRTRHCDQARVENVGSDIRVKIPWFFATIHMCWPMYSLRVAPKSKSFSAVNARASGSATIKISIKQSCSLLLLCSYSSVAVSTNDFLLSIYVLLFASYFRMFSCFFDSAIKFRYRPITNYYSSV